MEYFAGLDISMNETHICVLDRNGKVALEAQGAKFAWPRGLARRTAAVGLTFGCIPPHGASRIQPCSSASRRSA